MEERWTDRRELRRHAYVRRGGEEDPFRGNTKPKGHKLCVCACEREPSRGWFSSWTNTLDPTTVQVMETTGWKNTLIESHTKTTSSAPFLILHSPAFM